MNIYFITFGCKVNLYETAAMSESLKAAGFKVTEDKAEADIFVINSCTVTAESDSKLRQTMRKLRRDHPHAVIALTGCYPQAFPEKAALDDCADIVTGTKDRAALARVLKEFTEKKERICEISPYSAHDDFEKMSVSAVSGHTRGFIKIQDGCNCFCSYCIIPYSRGRIRSKPVEDILSETRTLAENGYREIVLVGINLGFYGAGDGIDIADAVKAVCSVEGICRVRLGSLEPERITEDILLRLAALPEFCPSFHYSLQSGCDKTLKAMNRRYDTEYYRQLISLTRRIFPDCGITTDIMTGFPGETEEDHIESMEFVREMSFSDVHVFPYSPREGTKAADFEGQVPMEIKKQRASQMTETGRENREKFLQSLIGKTFPVLFEREKSDGVHHGYAPNYAHVKILTKYSEKSLRNSIFYVTIDMMGENCCLGHIVPESELPPQL